MIIPCQEIGTYVKSVLRQQVVNLKEKKINPHLHVFLVGENAQQDSFVRIKQRIAHELGIQFSADKLPSNISSEHFLSIVRSQSEKKDVTGVIIQLPLPSHIDQKNVYACIPEMKEIEGHINPQKYHFPLSIAVMTAIKYLATQDIIQSLVSLPQDAPLLFNYLSRKKIVIAGRGQTGGGAIGQLLRAMSIPFNTVHSQTSNPQELFAKADIIITATGKKIIHPPFLTKGVILLNVGLRQEDGKLKGDYEEEEIRDIASWYTITPGGLGPIDVLYLYHNLLQATIENT